MSCNEESPEDLENDLREMENESKKDFEPDKTAINVEETHVPGEQDLNADRSCHDSASASENSAVADKILETIDKGKDDQRPSLSPSGEELHVTESKLNALTHSDSDYTTSLPSNPVIPSSSSLPEFGSCSSLSLRSASIVSSSSEEGGSVRETKYRRRKKRKRKVGEEERKVRLKAAAIEQALKNNDRDALARLAVSEGGLLSDEIRLRAWPRLLGINLLEGDLELPGDEEVAQHKDYNQVVLDVNRTLKRFPPGISDSARPLLQEQLTRLIVRVLMAEPELCYYQGYHDIAITLLLVVGEQLGVRMMAQLSVSHLRDFMAPSMERTMALLQLLYPLLRREQPSLHAYLLRAELGTMFALPWLITWFGHVLPEYSEVVRLYDFFLTSPPLMPVYLAAAVVMHREEEIYQQECDMAMIHLTLSKIPINLPYEELLAKCSHLYEKYPPYMLEKEAERDLRESRPVDRIEKRKEQYSTLVFKCVLYGAPVLLGVVIWRIYFSLQT